MPYWPPDSAPEAPPQMPQASTPGPAPVPYNGPGSALGPDISGPDPDVSATSTPGPGVLAGVTGANYVTESPLAAPNVNPYEAGAISPIYAGGDADAGGRDIVAGSVAAAVAAAEARFGELAGDTYGQGSAIGDLMTLPPNQLDAYYEPPRNYGDESV
jgi:hypothetical protein